MNGDEDLLLIHPTTALQSSIKFSILNTEEKFWQGVNSWQRVSITSTLHCSWMMNAVPFILFSLTQIQQLFSGGFYNSINIYGNQKSIAASIYPSHAWSRIRIWWFWSNSSNIGQIKVKLPFDIWTLCQQYENLINYCWIFWLKWIALPLSQCLPNSSLLI